MLQDSERYSEDGYDQIGHNPCNTLLFRGLDALTTEEGITEALAKVTGHTMKNSSVIRDTATGASRGFGFIEMSSVQIAMTILDALSSISPPFEIDGKQIIVTYAKNTFSTVMTTLQYGQQALQNDYNRHRDTTTSHQAADHHSGYDNNHQHDANHTNQYEQNYDYSGYYGNNVDPSVVAPPPPPQSTASQIDKTNAAAAVAQAAIQAAQANKQYQKAVSSEADRSSPTQTTSPDTEFITYPPPDVSTYQYDETSGYYYDSTTSLYYDASTQYYFNATTQQFMYWDAEKSTYLPAPNQEQFQDKGPDAPKEEKKDKEKKEKVKIAKKIAKDMEKWAKTLNAQKDNPGAKSIQPMNFGKESATADAGYSILAKAASKTMETDRKMMPPPPITIKMGEPGDGAANALVASYGGDSDSDEEGSPNAAIDESKLTDWEKNACLLCKRGFQSREMLMKHNQLSDLHKKNLETLIKSQAASSDEKKEYRDRAKERREKYGVPEPPQPRKGRPAAEPPTIIAEQPTKQGITAENKGNRMLQKMGWTEGQGLGKQKQGMVQPIEAKARNATAGLGAKGANIAADPSDSYKTAVRKTLYARYHEQDDGNN